MTINYIPFLKGKKNEISSLVDLDNDVLIKIMPLFDIPRENKVQDEDIIKKKIHTFIDSLDRTNFSTIDFPFYIDNYDLDDCVKINGIEQYCYILDLFKEYNITPVLGVNRSLEHNNSVYEYLRNNGGNIAIRLSADDIESYSITKRLLENIWIKLDILALSEVHLLIDLRYILPTNIAKFIHQVSYFLNKITNERHLHRVVISGSTIPANISDLLTTYECKIVERREWNIWSNLNIHQYININNIVFGDYGIVSPDYSDIELDPKLMRKVSAPKVFYTYKSNYLCIRGGSFQNDEKGNGQYFDIATIICEQDYFRDVKFSTGEKYIYDRSDFSVNRPLKAGSPSSWIKATLTSHITYIVRSLS